MRPFLPLALVATWLMASLTPVIAIARQVPLGVLRDSGVFLYGAAI
jgi:hypothetical protein